MYTVKAAFINRKPDITCMSARDISTKDLLILVKQDTKQGFELLYSKYSSALYGILIRIVDDMKIAEDLLQESYIKIWKNLDHYDESKGTLFTWMLNIARNTGIDHTRSKYYKNRQKSLSYDEINDDTSTVNNNTNLIGVRQLTLKLETKYRQVIELIYFKGHTHEEVAQILNIPLGTVKTRTRQALLTLRNNM
jgi:RNA polymerase sigma-70 factor (ECF subfamily)